MPIHIHQVLDYLDTHPIVQETDSMPSLLELLHDVFAAHNSFDSRQLRELFQKLRESLAMLSQAEYDAVFAVVCDLCLEHEQTAFSQGVLTGMLLMSEVNVLP